jgi:uncharacterized membrane protein YcaP (DUF421 family)
MPEIPQVRLILDDSINREEFRAIARRHDWLLHHVYEASDSNYEEVWTNSSQTVALH